MKARTVVLVALVLIVSTIVFSEEIEPTAIFKEVTAKYKSMQTYKAEGTIVSDIDSGGMKMNMETSFSIVLKKPNLYLVSWTQKNMPMPSMAQSGAVWNAGDQPYLYMGITNAYAKMGSDELALGGATGISGGAAFTIPFLFLPVFKGQGPLFSRLIEPKLEKIENIEGEECYVISGTSAISKKETFWISKTKHLLVKNRRSLEPPEGGIVIPAITDEQLEEAVKGMGLKVTEESKEKMKNMMKMSEDTMKLAKLKGTSTELHVKISTPELSKKDFEFTVPKGTILKESLFEGILRGDE